MKFVFVYELASLVSVIDGCNSVDEANRLFRLRSSKLTHEEFIQVYGNWDVYLESNQDLIFQHKVLDFWKKVKYHV